MRILIVGTTYSPALNGQAIFTANLAEGLAKRGHDVLMVFPSDKGHAYRTQRRDVRLEAVRSYSLGLLHADAYYSLFSSRAVRRIFDSFQPQIVHIQDHYPLSGEVLQEARRRGIKVVGTNHFMPENLAPYVPGLSKIKPLYHWIMWHWMLGLYNKVDATTAQSRTAAALIRKQGLRGFLFHISCGIDLTYFHPEPATDRRACRMRYDLDPQRTVFLFVGRIDREKRLDVVLRAMHLLRRDDVQLAIAGHGAALAELQALAEGLKLGDRVQFTGYIPNDDLLAILNSADIFVMPSEAELLSLATLEAMACGRPVLLANAVALPELAADGENGYLFKPGDPADMARCMELLAGHPERWPAMGAASLERVRFHSLENTISLFEFLYESLMKNAPLNTLESRLAAI
jgi:1,2-diacylglycerol 3-alpha-glucosyltransferase